MGQKAVPFWDYLEERSIPSFIRHNPAQTNRATVELMDRGAIKLAYVNYRHPRAVISVILITKNEEKKIERCLDSVSWADEIIVVDSGSSDQTVALCEAKGAQVTITDWPGFGAQKNRALALAQGPWILSLDADEYLRPEGQQEILSVIARDTQEADAFAIPRESSYCGRIVKHSGWSPDYVVRLFRKDRCRFSDDLVHERLLVTGSVGKLCTPLCHESFDSLEEVLDKINHYSTAAATMRHARGETASLFSAVMHGAWAFFRTFILRAGFLDGTTGFMLAVSNAEGVYYRYAKMMLLTRRGQ